MSQRLTYWLNQWFCLYRRIAFREGMLALPYPCWILVLSQPLAPLGFGSHKSKVVQSFSTRLSSGSICEINVCLSSSPALM